MKIDSLMEPQVVQIDEGKLHNIAAAAMMVLASIGGVKNMINTSSDDANRVVSGKVTHQKQAAADTIDVDKAVELASKKYKRDPKEVRQVIRAAIKHSNDTFPTARDLIALVGVESSFNPKAVSQLKKDPAVGLTQIRPGVWGIDPKDLSTIDQQMSQASRILQKYYKLTGSREDALHAYNIGIGNLKKYKRGNIDGNPKYVAKIDAEKNSARELM